MRFAKVVLIVVVALSVSISACAQMDYDDRYGDQDRYRDQDRYGEQDSRYDDYNYDYTVEFFEHSDYRGNSQRYELTRDKRHVLIEFIGWDMNDRLSSMRLGRGVGVALFRDREFKGPVAIYEFDTPLLDSDANDWASSAIIFDREMGGPLGVWIGERDDPNKLFSTGFNGEVRFYPLSEDVDDMEVRYNRIDEFNDNVEWVVLGPATSNMFRSRGRGGYQSRYGSRGGGSQIEVAIYEHGDMRGRSVMFPSRHGRGQTYFMDQYNFNRIASSMIIREIRSRW
jgi:hypothetical protein